MPHTHKFPMDFLLKCAMAYQRAYAPDLLIGGSLSLYAHGMLDRSEGTDVDFVLPVPNLDEDTVVTNCRRFDAYNLSSYLGEARPDPLRAHSVCLQARYPLGADNNAAFTNILPPFDVFLQLESTVVVSPTLVGFQDPHAILEMKAAMAREKDLLDSMLIEDGRAR